MFILPVCFLAGCAGVSQVPPRPGVPAVSSNFLVPGQLPAPQSIKSIQLYRKGSPNNVPAIHLNSSQKLVLAFDELSRLSGQFRIHFTHHDAHWQNSNIPEDWFLEGMNELILGSGTPNRMSEPRYHRYEMEFPNRQIKFKASGNYMLHVSDFASGTPLFSLPFFVTEDAGTIVSHSETLFNIGPRGAAMHQPFSTYAYPDFVQFPQFDLSFFFVQNRFWGNSREASIFDTSTEGETAFHLSREASFAANFDFILLDARQFTQGGKIIEWNPASVPPKVLLREDVLNFLAYAQPRTDWISKFGNPNPEREARYASVRFRFDGGGQFHQQTPVYLTGDFNQWILSDAYTLIYNPETGYMEREILIKEGSYTYKYALKNPDGSVDDLTLSDSVTRSRQEYASMVYFRDPEYQFQRLLQFQIFYSE